MPKNGVHNHNVDNQLGRKTIPAQLIRFGWLTLDIPNSPNLKDMCFGILM